MHKAVTQQSETNFKVIKKKYTRLCNIYSHVGVAVSEDSFSVFICLELAKKIQLESFGQVPYGFNSVFMHNATIYIYNGKHVSHNL